MRLIKVLWPLLALLGVMLLPGCGGGSAAPTDPAVDYSGTYTGSYAISGGPDAGQSGTFSMVVSSSNSATATATDTNSNTSTFLGSVGSDGRFTLLGTGTVSGQLVKSGASTTGSVTLNLSNGNFATFTIS